MSHKLFQAVVVLRQQRIDGFDRLVQFTLLSAKQVLVQKKADDNKIEK